MEPASPAARLHALLRERSLRIATAESLTGGLVAAALTDVPGSSATYVGGVVSYATALKQQLLGVPEALVAEHGVVSAACAEAMARGARQLTGAECAVSTTGVAGPDLAEGKPAGTVFVGVALPQGVWSVALQLSGDREQVRADAVAEAIDAVRRILVEEEPPVR